jgi:hypothetical protein
MSVSQRVQLLSDKVEELSILKEFLTNPKLIEQLADEVKGLHALTKDEEIKLAEAKKLLRDHDAIVDVLQKRETALNKSIADHEKEVEADHVAHSQAIADFTSDTKTRADKLAAQEKDLSQRVALQADKENKHIDDVRKFSGEKEKASQSIIVDRKRVEASLARSAALEADNITKAEKLAAFEKKLKEAAEKMQNLISG